MIPYASFKPKDVDDATWKSVIEAWENGLSDREACFRASKHNETITLEEIKGWLKANPKLAELKTMLESDLRSVAKDTVATSLREGDVKTAKWYLERKAADEFSTKQAVAFEGAVIELSIEDKEKALKDMVEKFEGDGE